MALKDKFITPHVFSAGTGGTQLYHFETTIRDVYAFRIRWFTNGTFITPSPAIVFIVCPQLVSGTRWGTINGTKVYHCAQFVTNIIGPNLPVKNPKMRLDAVTHINKLQFQFIDETGNFITFDGASPPWFEIDFYQENKLIS